MINPIQISELLERVAGNREFVILMLDMFFHSSDERLLALRNEFNNRNYQEMSNQVHKLKGLVSNLSINKALAVLSDLQKESEKENDQAIEPLLQQLDEIILEAKNFYSNNPSLILD